MAPLVETPHFETLPVLGHVELAGVTDADKLHPRGLVAVVGLHLTVRPRLEVAGPPLVVVALDLDVHAAVLGGVGVLATRAAVGPAVVGVDIRAGGPARRRDAVGAAVVVGPDDPDDRQRQRRPAVVELRRRDQPRFALCALPPDAAALVRYLVVPVGVDHLAQLPVVDDLGVPVLGVVEVMETERAGARVDLDLAVVDAGRDALALRVAERHQRRTGVEDRHGVLGALGLGTALGVVDGDGTECDDHRDADEHQADDEREPERLRLRPVATTVSSRHRPRHGPWIRGHGV